MKRGRPRHDDILTPREWQVLALLRDGLSNEAIASRLGISLDTAKFHVSEILGKLGVNSREEAARWEGEPRRGWTGWLPVWVRWPLAAGALAGIVALIFVAAGGFGSSGGGDPGVGLPSGGELADFDATPTPISPPRESQPGQVNDLEFRVCIDDESWQRPALAQQAAHIDADNRYAPFSDRDRSQFTASFWAPLMDGEIIWTVIRASGLWTLGDVKVATAIDQGCPRRPDRNNLDLIRVWLFGFEVNAVVSEAARLAVFVTRRPAGYQVVEVHLPSSAMDYAGRSIDFVDATGTLLARIDTGSSFCSCKP